VETISRLWLADPRLQVVICTAYSDHSWEEILSQVGNTDSLVILKKPFDNIEVLQLAQALCKKWHLSQEIQCRLNNLEQAVAARTRELLLAKTELERANANLELHVAERTRQLAESEKRYRLQVPVRRGILAEGPGSLEGALGMPGEG
jgi:hypothetical protein